MIIFYIFIFLIKYQTWAAPETIFISTPSVHTPASNVLTVTASPVHVTFPKFSSVITKALTFALQDKYLLFIIQKL